MKTEILMTAIFLTASAIAFVKRTARHLTLLRSQMSDKNWPSLAVKKFIFLLLFVGFAFGSSALAQSQQPNIVIILADDMGYGDVSYNGCPDYQTPNIDAFASNGILCTNGYVSHPFCSPSRAGLLTGRYQQRFGHEENLVGDNDNPRLGLPETEITLPQILKPAGYVCGTVGKWHLASHQICTHCNADLMSFSASWDPTLIITTPTCCRAKLQSSRRRI